MNDYVTCVVFVAFNITLNNKIFFQHPAPFPATPVYPNVLPSDLPPRLNLKGETNERGEYIFTILCKMLL